MMSENKTIVYKNKFRQLFCKHDYVTGELQSSNNMYQFHNISGEQITTICVKCGKIKNSYFREYEGMGYK